MVLDDRLGQISGNEVLGISTTKPSVSWRNCHSEVKENTDASLVSERLFTVAHPYNPVHEGSKLALALYARIFYNAARALKRQAIAFAALTASIALCTPSSFGFGENATLRIIETQTTFIRHTATEYQRKIADQNAKAFFKQLTPAKKADLTRKKVKTVLIRTVRSPQTSPEAKEVRMCYDLESGALIDDSAYEFTAPLPTETVAKVKGLEPEYVGP